MFEIWKLEFICYLEFVDWNFHNDFGIVFIHKKSPPAGSTGGPDNSIGRTSSYGSS